MATGRRLISVVTCIFFAQGLEVVCAQGGFGSDAIAGIVVACIAVLIIIIGGVVVYMVWRSRRRAAKNTNSAAAASAQESASVEGHAHPADIPIEAVNRIPPPAYAQPTPRRQPGRSRAQNGGSRPTPGPHPPPPPYSPPQGSTAADISCCDEAPPEYRSRVGLNSSGVEPRRSDPQSVSVDSFAEYPSMRNILLTSSRSSLQGTDSRHASTQSDRSSSAGGGGGGAGAAVSMSPAGRPSSGRRRDSAQGDSAYSKSSPSDDFAADLRRTHRQISTSSSALNDPRVCVPEGGLQRRARRSKQAAATANNAALNRSCPSLEDELATTQINTSHRQQQQQQQQHHHHYDDDHHHHHRRRRRVSAENGAGNQKSDSTKRGRHQRRREERSSSTEFSDDQMQVHRGYSTDSDLASSPRTGFGGRYQIAGTTDV